MDKKFILIKDKYSSKEVADIIYNIMWEVDREKLIKKYDNITICFDDTEIYYKVFGIKTVKPHINLQFEPKEN